MVQHRVFALSAMALLQFASPASMAQTAPPSQQGDPDVYKLLLERQVDAVTFTSASSVRHFVKALGEEQAPDLLSGTVVASIGPVTAEAAQQLGITSTIVPTEYTVPGLVKALVEHFRRG